MRDRSCPDSAKASTTSPPTSKQHARIDGPIATWSSFGEQESSRPSAATVSDATRSIVPRQPACTAATAFRLEAQNNRGTQSAAWTITPSPGSFVASASHSGTLRDSFVNPTVFSCTCFMCATRSRPSAVFNVSRSCSPRSRRPNPPERRVKPWGTFLSERALQVSSSREGSTREDSNIFFNGRA